MAIFRLCLFSVMLLLSATPLSAQVSSFPYTESFDAVAAPALPAGWSSSEARVPGTPDFVTSASSARSLPNVALSTNATIAQCLVSSIFDFSTTTPETLFFAVRRSSSHLAGLIVEASSDGGTSFPYRLCDTIWNTGTTSYLVVACALPSILASCPSVRLRWRTVPAASGSTGTLRIDDIGVTARAACDLAIQRIDLLPAHPREGEPFSLAVTVANCGTLPVPVSTLVCNRVMGNDTLPAASFPLALLNAGDSLSTLLPLGNASPGAQSVVVSVTAQGDGNAGNNLRSVSFAVALRRGSLVVSEIMYAPIWPQPEWVELQNTRDVPVDLAGWSIADGSGTRHRISSPVAAAPGGYILLTADSSALVSLLHVPAPVVQVTGFPSLNNGGDAVVLSDATGAEMDSVCYDPAWGGSAGCSLERIDPLEPSTEASSWSVSVDSLGATPGRRNSIARLPHDLALNGLSATCALPGASVQVQCTIVNVGSEACDGFTVRVERLALPGMTDTTVAVDTARHSIVVLPCDVVSMTLFWKVPVAGLSRLRAVVQSIDDERPSNDARCCTVAVPFSAGSLVINEIMAAPLPGDAEYCEFLNPGPADVDIAGWSLSDRPTSEGSANRWPLSDSASVVHSGEYLVVASDSALFRRFGTLTDMPPRLIRVMAAGSLGLNNDGDDVVVHDASGATIDSVSYSHSWYNPALVDPAGHALERIAPHMASCDHRSWSSSVASGGGTPGRQNSVYTRKLPSGSRLACAPNPFSPDGDGVDDIALIHYELPAQQSLLSISLYDITGHRIRHLVDAEPAGPSGDVPWDGRTDGTVRARIGIYIVFLEAVDQASGNTLTAKTTIVLAGRL